MSAAARHPRVVSLLPSATELVCAVGMADALVGVSHECDFPGSVVGKPVLTRSRLTLSFGDSEAIDRDVRDLLARALAIYELDADVLKAAEPDVVITQDLCDVCAVPRRDVEAAVAEHLGPGVKLLNLSPTRLEHVWDEHADPFTNTVRVTVGTLRRKLEAVGGPSPIETVIGAGYRLVDGRG